MALTKTQLLTALNRLRKRQMNKKSSKSIAMAFCYIMVEKDLITAEDLVAKFPELDNTT